MRKYNVGWGITNACNMNCKFCYSKDTRHSTSDTTLKDWIKFVDENHEYIDSINYGTGENAISNDFFKFISYVRENYPSITQSLTSNGYIYERVSKDPELYDIYKKSIDEVDVSLDFAIPEKHNFFRGQPKAYDWAINTLKMLQKDKKTATIVFVGFEETMTPENIDGLFEIAKKYDALIRLNIYRPVSDNKEINKKFILSYKTLMSALEYINEKYKVVTLSDVLLGNIYTREKDIKENTGIDSIRILPDGSICPSTYLITKDFRNKYNIKQENVLSKVKFEDFIEAPIPEKCKDCEIRNKCKGGVYDRRMLWNKTLKERDPYCPFENNDDINKKQFKTLKKKRVSVHDGYLPTMFFKN
ncbi:MAG: radical SAM protein [Tenericutes bacterium]|nr:radical SAM protein [Mycoplasmatota bacterium]